MGGNTGTTLGQQRMIALQYAADIWGELLDSEVPIVVEATFAGLPCVDPETAEIGSASPVSVVSNLDAQGADPLLYYPIALANRFFGDDIFPGDPDWLPMWSSVGQVIW